MTEQLIPRQYGLPLMTGMRFPEGDPDTGLPSSSTDKYDHNYVGRYKQIAAELGTKARVCELGVYYGASLNLWKELFPDGMIAGVDGNSGAWWPKDTIKIVARQEEPDLVPMLWKYSDKWDLIVDDCSHFGELTATSLANLWPLVSAGGYYVIEDWVVGFSHWLDYDRSMLTLAENLIGNLDGDTDLESIEYRYGMIIMKKKVPDASD